MRLRNLLEVLRRDLSSPRHQLAFQRARQRHAALAECPDIPSVLDALGAEKSASDPACDALVRALALEHQAGEKPLWASVLLVAFRPALLALRRSSRWRTVEPHELDQLIVTGFVDALERQPARSTHVSARLCGDTSRFVLRTLVAERDRRSSEQRVAAAICDDQSQAIPGHAVKSLEDHAREQVEFEALWQWLLDRNVPKSKLDLILATLIHGESLCDYVAQVARAVSDKERVAAYARLCVNRQRTLQKLRPLLRWRLPFGSPQFAGRSNGRLQYRPSSAPSSITTAGT